MYAEWPWILPDALCFFNVFRNRCALCIFNKNSLQHAIGVAFFTLILWRHHSHSRVTQKYSLDVCLISAWCRTGVLQSYRPWSPTEEAWRNLTCKSVIVQSVICLLQSRSNPSVVYRNYSIASVAWNSNYLIDHVSCHPQSFSNQCLLLTPPFQ